MDFRILDQNFVDKVMLTSYESLLWVDRYNEPGDFEIYTPPTEELLEYAKVDNYLYSKDSEHTMIIEHVELTTSYEEGPRMIIKGRSLESILDRRILWYKTQIRDNIEDSIRQLLDWAIIDPTNDWFIQRGMYTDLDRKIDNFVFEYSRDPKIKAAFVDVEYGPGTDILTVIKAVCKAANIGFKITLNNNDQFVFKLYKGENRSYTQESNPWVVFSPRYHNLKTTQFSNDTTTLKNCVRTVGKSIDGAAPDDFLTYGNNRMNILDLSDFDEEAPVVQIPDVDDHDYHKFEFTIGKLTVGETYSFSSKVEIHTGEPTSLLIKLTGELDSRVYASQTVEIQNGRITADLVPLKPDPAYDDCYFLYVYIDHGDELELVNPIFAPGAYSFKASGLSRREVYNDASSVEYTDEMTYEEYENQLTQSAIDTLDANIIKTTINGEVEVDATYQYKKDYFIGDVVQVENEFGVLGTMRVVEFITSHSNSGIEMYPTFKTTEGGE